MAHARLLERGRRPVIPPPELETALIAIIDCHTQWLAEWSHATMHGCDLSGHPLLTPELDCEHAAMQAFAGFVAAAAERQLSAQPATLRLVALHEALHDRARQMLQLRLLTGRLPAQTAHAELLSQYVEFMRQLRRFERAFASAASRLDTLTGLRSRKGMMDELARELARFDRHGEPFCIAVCDIDRFKSVNDTYGHAAGDQVLEAVALRLDRALRSFDDLYRMGGEEFLLVLKHVAAEQALPVLERLRHEVSAAPVGIGDGQSLTVTASFGFTEVRSGIDLDALIEEADGALYAAKRGGRDCVKRWAPPVEA